MALENDRFERVPLLKNGKPVLNKQGKPKMMPYSWEYDYKIIYFWTSHYVHVNVESLDNHSIYPEKPFRIYTQGSRPQLRSTDLGDMALFNTAIYLHKILVAAFRALGHTYPEELAGYINRLLDSFIKEKSS
jgi:hypothetical protein